MDKERGNLYIFTGYAPGVGKSYQMVKKAVEQMETKKVIIGFLNSEHRDIAQMRKDYGIKKMFRRKYSISRIMEEHPDIVVMDELGMSLLNKERKSFVYEDVEELLDLGVDVYASANLKKFTSLNPLFKEITGIGIRKTIPDQFLEDAKKIYFVDRDPMLLRVDFVKGLLFEKEKMNSRIMQKNFKPDNLKAYRELSLKVLQEKYPEQLEIIERN